MWTGNVPEVGSITKFAHELQPRPILIGDKPLEAGQCSFTLKFVSPEVESIKNIDPFASSNYLNFDIGDSICTTIGITSITQFDRLVDICLTNLVQGETAEFLLLLPSWQIQTPLKIQMTLNFIHEPQLELHAMKGEQLLEIATLLKSQGVESFNVKNHHDAFFKFSKALKYLILIDDLINPDANLQHRKYQLMTMLKNNLAAIHLASSSNENKWSVIIQLCDQVLARDEDNVKALYRRGSAFLEVHEYEKSRSDFERVKQLDLINMGAVVDAKLDLVRKKLAQLNQKRASVYRKMFTPAN